MPAILVSQMRARHGLEADLPQLGEGELAFAADTGSVFIGAQNVSQVAGRTAFPFKNLRLLTELDTTLGSGSVASVAGRTGNVTLVVSDVSGAAPLTSPTFFGVPSGPTATAGTSTTQFATTGFVSAAITALGYNPAAIALTGGTIDGTLIGSTIPRSGAFTTLSASSTVSGTGFSTYLSKPPAIGSTTPSTGAFTTLSASSTVSGGGFATYLASPPAIGSTTPSTGAFTTLSASSTVSGTGFTTLLTPYAPLASPTLTGTPNAPTALAGTSNRQIATTEFVNSAITASGTAPAAYTAYRNKLINPRFNIFQVGSPNTSVTVNNAITYVQDGWIAAATGACSTNLTIVPTTADIRAGLTDESAEYEMRMTPSGVPGTNDYSLVCQRMEDVLLTAGKMMSFGFWAYSSSVGSAMTVEFTQNFGTGGSPSAAVTGICQQRFIINTGIQFFSITPILIPSVSSKTLGTNNDSFFTINFWLRAGTTIGASRGGNVSGFSGTIHMFKPQLEIGTVNTPFEMRPTATDMVLCQRYYESGAITAGGPVGAAGFAFASIQFKATKFVTPTISLTSPGYANVTSASAAGINVNNAYYQANIAGAGAWSAGNTWVADARI